MTTKRLDDFNSNNKKGKGEKHVSYGKLLTVERAAEIFKNYITE